MKKVILLLVVFMCIFACDDKEPVESMIQLKKDQPTQFEFDGKEGAAIISFIAGSTWFFQKDTVQSDWYSILPIQGKKGEVSVTVQAVKNESKVKRTSFFTLFCGNESQRFTIS